MERCIEHIYIMFDAVVCPFFIKTDDKTSLTVHLNNENFVITQSKWIRLMTGKNQTYWQL